MGKTAFCFALTIMLFFIFGCGLFGPSDEDVAAAIKPAISAFVPSSEEFGDAISELRYQDYAELSYGNEYQTVMQNITFQLDREEKYLSLDGVCTLNTFYDESTGYLMSGTVEYSVGGYIESQSPINTEIVFDVTYIGGPVKSISFSANEQSLQDQQQPVVMVNGKKHEFNDQIIGRAFNFFSRGFRSI